MSDIKGRHGDARSMDEVHTKKATSSLAAGAAATRRLRPPVPEIGTPASAPIESPDYLWTVRYRRKGWTQEQARYFRQRYAAQRLVGKLRGDSWRYDDLEPLEYVRLERQTLGPVEVVREWKP